LEWTPPAFFVSVWVYRIPGHKKAKKTDF